MRRLDLTRQLDRLLDVGREPAEDGVEDAARLAGGDHVDEEVVEGPRVLPEGVGEGGARLHVLPDGQDDLLERLVVLLRPEDLEALHEGEARVDHDRELPREDGEALGVHLPGAELRDGELLAPLLDRGDLDLAPAQVGDREVLRVGREDALRS